MLKVYRNILYQTAREAGVDTVLFAREGEDGSFIIRMQTPPIEFEVMHSPRNFHEFRCRYKRFAPGLPYAAVPIRSDSVNRGLSAERLREIETIGAAHWVPTDGNWDIERVRLQFQAWLEREVKAAVEEQTTPNLWERLADGATPFDASGGQEERGFEPDERELVQLAISQFRLLVVHEFEPDEEQLTHIDDQLTYLSNALDRLNRFDWKALALSTVIGIATTLSLDTAAGKRLWSFFQQAFHAVGHLLSS